VLTRLKNYYFNHTLINPSIQQFYLCRRLPSANDYTSHLIRNPLILLASQLKIIKSNPATAHNN